MSGAREKLGATPEFSTADLAVLLFAKVNKVHRAVLVKNRFGPDDPSDVPMSPEESSALLLIDIGTGTVSVSQLPIRRD